MDKPESPNTDAPAAGEQPEMVKTSWKSHFHFLRHLHPPRRKVGLFVILTLIFTAFLGFSTIAYIDPLSTTTIGNVELSTQDTKEAIKTAIEKQASEYVVSIKSPSGETKTFTLAQMGMGVDSTASAEIAYNFMRAKSFGSRLSWWDDTELRLTAGITNQKIFKNFLASQTVKAVKPAKNAKIAISNGSVVLTHQVNGAGQEIPDVKSQLIDAIVYLKPVTLTFKDSSIEPAITDKNTAEAKAVVEKMMAQKIVFKIEGNTITATPADIGGWIELSPVDVLNTVDVTVNSGKVLAYINNLSAGYVQPAQSQIVMTQPDGRQVVLVRGQNGVDVENKEKISADIATKVQKSESVTVDLPVKYAAFATVKTNGYPKWIVVDVTSKVLYAYEGSKLVRTVLVSAGAPATPTVLGEYKIYSKVRIQDMQGSNADGSRYFQPDVEWTNYFYGSYALHGNYWRPPEWFGNINSSHGCVGMQNFDAEWIYNWAPVGTPVIIHQ